MLSDRHPIVGMILEYRGLRKLLVHLRGSAAAAGQSDRRGVSIPRSIRPSRRPGGSVRRIRTCRTFRSATNGDARSARRSCLRTSDHLLLSADYSQVELRLMAHLSEDPTMIAAFSHGADIHTETAAPAVRRSGRRGDARTAAAGQNGQFRHYLRHFGFRSGPAVADSAQRGQRDHRRLFRYLPWREGLYGACGRARLARRGYVDDAVRTQADVARHPFGQCGGARAWPSAMRSMPRYRAVRPTS